MAKKRRSKDDLKEIDVLVERLRGFVRLNYMTAAEVPDRSALMILPWKGQKGTGQVLPRLVLVSDY